MGENHQLFGLKDLRGYKSSTEALTIFEAALSAQEILNERLKNFFVDSGALALTGDIFFVLLGNN